MTHQSAATVIPPPPDAREPGRLVQDAWRRFTEDVIPPLRCAVRGHRWRWLDTPLMPWICNVCGMMHGRGDG